MSLEKIHKDFHAAFSCGLKHLKENYGNEAVVRFWEGISDEFLFSLRILVKEEGN